jgi:KDO2-lipid IV(A) lauroyltransferase
MNALRIAGSWVVVGLLWLIRFLPERWIAAMGDAIGALLYRFGRGYVTRVNLAMCFPELDEAQREAIGVRHFQMLARNALELGIMAFGSDADLQRLTRVEGIEHLRSHVGKPVIVLAPHFVGLNMGGIRVAWEIPESASIYSRQKNPVLDWLFLRSRSRFGSPVLVSRQEGLRAVVRVMRSGKAFYFLPDMDFGMRDAIFSPFFGVPTATITALPRLAKLAGAVVVPVVTRQDGDGYVARFYPAWEDYPTGDLEADVRRMNAFIEDRAREMPEQYFWAHKRFKTRPPGEPNPYRRKK